MFKNKYFLGLFFLVSFCKIYSQTYTYTPFPVFNNLGLIEDRVLQGYNCEPINEQQANFLSHYRANFRYLDLFLPEELKSFVATSYNYQAINQELVRQGFDIQLNRPANGNSLAVASILDVQNEWLCQASEEVLRLQDGNLFKAISMRSEDNKVEVCEFPDWSINGERNPVLIIHTKGKDGAISGLRYNDIVYITKVKNPQDIIFNKINELNGKITALRDATRDIKFGESADRGNLGTLNPFKNVLDYFGHNVSTNNYQIIIPKISLDRHKEDISFLLGLKFVKSPEDYFQIVQALQQTKFDMDEFGIKLKSATVADVCRGGTEYFNICIDQPFYLWIERRVIKDKEIIERFIYFWASFDKDSWVKN